MQLTKNNLIIIEKIKSDYKFAESFDFIGWVFSIKEWVEGVKEYEDLDKYRKRKERLLLVQKTIISLRSGSKN